MNGFVIPVRDTQSLVKVMEEFLQMNKTDREIMGKAGRRKMVREFDEALVLNVYDQAITRYLVIGAVESHQKNVV